MYQPQTCPERSLCHKCNRIYVFTVQPNKQTGMGFEIIKITQGGTIHSLPLKERDPEVQNGPKPWSWEFKIKLFLQSFINRQFEKSVKSISVKKRKSEAERRVWPDSLSSYSTGNSMFSVLYVVFIHKIWAAGASLRICFCLHSSFLFLYSLYVVGKQCRAEQSLESPVHIYLVSVVTVSWGHLQ